MLWCFLEDFNILGNSLIGCLTQEININLSSVDSIPTQFLDSISQAHYAITTEGTRIVNEIKITSIFEVSNVLKNNQQSKMQRIL